MDFVVGGAQVVMGLDEGVVGMCPGDIRTVVVMPDKGYGSVGVGAQMQGGMTWEGIPGDATLEILVKMLKVT